MKQDTVIYRPPREARTPLLPVTNGCSHNRCGFCNMYRDTSFYMYDDASICEYLAAIRAINPHAERIYLVGGDPFCMRADRLHHIIDLIQADLPSIKTITMYASVQNIAHKSSDDLLSLRARGVNQLYIGLETGDDDLLKQLNKGFSRQQAIEQLNRLTKADISYGVIIMTGLAGKDGGIHHAIETATLMNQIHARVLYCNSLVVMPDTPLGALKQQGEFVEASEYERQIELLTLLKHLNPPSKLLVNSYHVSNALNINVEIPDEQASIIARLEQFLSKITPAVMQAQFQRENMRI